MQNLAWYQGESQKQFLQGAALGAFAGLGIGFSWGGLHAWKHGEDPGGQHGQ